MRPRLAPFLSFLLLILVLLTTLNLSTYLTVPKVLGLVATTVNQTEVDYWQNFLNQNPGYFPGWLEIYRLTNNLEYLNKAKVINPNYF